MTNRSAYSLVLSHKFSLSTEERAPEFQLFTEVSGSLEESAFVIVIDVEIDGQPKLAHVEGYTWSKLLGGSYMYWRPTTDGLLHLPKMPSPDRDIEVTLSVLEWKEGSSEHVEAMTLLEARELDNAVIMEPIMTHIDARTETTALRVGG